MSEIKLKPCPFCGATPTLLCDLTDWKGDPVYKPNESGYRPKVYRLSAEHREGCFIRQMNGMNKSGEISAFNWEFIVETWNSPAKNCQGVK